MLKQKSFIFFIFLTVICTQLFSQELLSVRVDADYPPYEMVIDGQLTGFHIDQVKAVAEVLNLNITFRAYPWARAIKMVEDGDADIITYVGRNPEREEFLHYQDGNVLSSANYAFIVLSSRASEINYAGNLQALRNFKIGIQRGYFYGSEFDSADFLNKVAVSGVLQITTMLRSKRIDLAVIDEPEFYMQKNNNNWDYLDMLYPVLSNNDFYIGFSKAKGHEQLSKDFADALTDFRKTDDYQNLLIKYKLNQ